VEYKPGCLNATTDALLRHAAKDTTVHALSLLEIEFFDQFRCEAAALPETIAKCAAIQTGTVGPAWPIIDDVVQYQGRIFLPPSSDYWAPVLEQVHDMGHERVQKTLQRLHASFFTSHDNQLVCEFVKGCVVFKHHKTEHLHPAGLLQPLGVPSSI
jgi:hypothetical protein